MKILLLGKVGQLGWELRRVLPGLGPVTAYDFPEVDFTHLDDLLEKVRAAQPDVIVNAVAYTAVDRAEAEMDTARLVNAAAPGALAALARELKAPIIHYSTDYVFDGAKGAAYVESDPTHPLNAYGLTKLEGEQAVLAAGGAGIVLRTAWVYSTRQGGFVTKALQWARQQQTLSLVTDQVSSPTWARSLAEATGMMLAQAAREPGAQSPYVYLGDRAGVYHLAGEGAASRYEWGQAILELDPRREEQTVRELKPALTADFPSPAERPLVSPLDCARFRRTFGFGLPHWRDALALAMEPA